MANEYKINQTFVEVLNSGQSDSPIKVNQTFVEVLNTGQVASPLRINQMFVEVLHSLAEGTGLPTVTSTPTAYPLSFDVTGTELPLVASAPTAFAPESEEGPRFVTKPDRTGVPELNPYRPDIPVEIDTVLPQLYDYQRELSETLRKQHNLLQAGDSTFSWEVLTYANDTKVYSLGSLGRFYHPTYGLLIARYVKFDSMVDTEEFTAFPVGRIGEGSVDWVVTNDFSLSSSDMTVGVAMLYQAVSDGQYGWVVTQGANLVTIPQNTPAVPNQNDYYTWTATGGLTRFGTGKVVARVWGETSEFNLHPGILFVDIEGPSQAQIALWFEQDFTDINELLTDLGERLTELENSTESSAAIAALQASVATLSSQLTVETSNRVARDNYILGLLAGRPFATLVQLNSTRDGLIVTINALDAALRVLITNAQNRADSAYAIASAINVAGLQAQIDALGSLIGNFVSRAGDTMTGPLEVPDDPYDAGVWDSNVEVPTKNALRDKFESLTAADIDNVPGGNIVGTNVQTALDELDSEKVAKAGDTMTGTLLTVDVRPAANDGGALGSAALSYSDLFLANGAVINFNAGDYTLTHSAGLLTTSGRFRSGNIGVNISAPAAGGMGLDVTTIGSDIARFNSTNALGGQVRFGKDTQESVFGANFSSGLNYVGTSTNHAFGFVVNNALVGQFDTSGNFGIGATPSGRLHASSGSSPNAAQIIFGYLGASTNYYDANTQIFRDGAFNETMRLDSSGLTVDTNTLVVDTTNNRVGIGTASPLRTLHVRADALGAITQAALDNENTANGSGTVMSFRGATTGVGAASFYEFGALEVTYTTHDHPTSASEFAFYIRSAGSQVAPLVIAPGFVRPATNDLAALGSATLSWSDLFLASGGVINFANGNYTLTHSAGLLTASGNLRLPTTNTNRTSGLEFGTNVGQITRSNNGIDIEAFDYVSISVNASGGHAAGTEAGRFTSGGSLAIGTTSPVSKLHVNNANTNETHVTAGNNNGGMMLGVATTGVGQVFSYAGAAITFGNYNAGGAQTEWGRFDSSGNLGIGASPPSDRRLYVERDVNAGAKVTYKNPNTGTGAFVQHELISGSTSLIYYAFNQNYTTSGRYVQASSLVASEAGAGGLGLSSVGGPIRFWTNGDNERLRIDTSGNVQMGGANTVIDANRHHQLRSYTVAGLPSAATAGQMIYVSNESGGAVVAFSDGTNWRRVTDRAVVS